jgi:hypothetical protein
MVAIFPAIIVVAMVLALVDIIMRDESQVRYLPKFGWVLLVILLPLIGTVLWFILGREYGSASVAGIDTLARARRQSPSVPAAQVGPPAPAARTTEEQLADLDREIEYYERRAELERLKREAEGEPTS